jgi:hypothetical protein
MRYLFGVLRIEIGEFARGDDRRGETAADFFAPEDSRSARNGHRDLFSGSSMAGAIGSAPLRPVAGVGLEGKEAKE